MKRITLILLTLIALLLFTARAKAQEIKMRYILFSGVVMDATSQKELPKAFYEINEKRGGLTDEQGKFSFYALPTDTIVFSFLGYEDYPMVVSDTLVSDEYLIGIFMQEDTVILDEIVIVPRLRDIRLEILNQTGYNGPETRAANNNIRAATYTGLTTRPKTGSADENYRQQRMQLKQQAIEKGGIPSERMINFSPLTMIPAAIYLLKEGFPEPPPPPKPRVYERDMNSLIKSYLERKKEQRP